MHDNVNPALRHVSDVFALIKDDGMPDDIKDRAAPALFRMALDVHAPYANARSKLIVLKSLDTPEVADGAALAWNRLSLACHVHAFEMQPSTAEIERLCGVVAALLPADTGLSP